MRRIAAVAIAALCTAMLLSGSTFVFADNLIGNEIEEITSFTYKLFDTEEKYENELKLQMERVYNSIQPYIVEDEVVPIPGIIKTVYTDKGSVKSSKYYIPQGLCMTDEYILMTAYHDSKVKGEKYETNKGWNGVLYVIGRDSKELLSTFVLPQDYHNGGIAFDGQNVWFCGDTKDSYFQNGNEPFVQYMKYDRLKGLVAEGGSEIMESDFSDKVYISNKPSFLECDDGILWVGTYKNNEPDEYGGYAIGYPIKDIEGAEPGLEIIDVYRINNIASSCQGMDIDGNNCYISSSGHGGENWIQSSFVARYDISELKNGNKCLDLSSVNSKSIEVPKMNEEIIVDSSYVYIVFEASSEKFLKKAPKGMKTDRILVIDKKLWE